jgi:hypothetical protein
LIIEVSHSHDCKCFYQFIRTNCAATTVIGRVMVIILMLAGMSLIPINTAALINSYQTAKFTGISLSDSSGGKGIISCWCGS